MCGIAGFWKKGGEREDVLRGAISQMTEALSHRGPDARGWWIDREAGIALGHRRLSVLDLSWRGNQPMYSFCGRYIIVYNGEVYNYVTIREELQQEGVRFKSNCDTEVVINAISRWGIDSALKRFNGMFVFTLWDKKERKLYIARDRIGIKPLYYGLQDGMLFISSELKSMRANVFFKPAIDKNSLALYFRYNYIPAPYSVYAGVGKIKQAHYIIIDKEFNIIDHCYWDALKISEEGAQTPFKKNEEEIIDELNVLLKDAVAKRMISDVPLGVFLSGGVDSSLITALMQVQSSASVKTFTLGFYDDKFNEAKQAKEVAKHLGTDHTELYVTPSETMSVIAKLPFIYDEPFSDYSQIPTVVISELTRRQVTVNLSGDGGDETFGGYNRHLWANRVWQGIRVFPKGARHATANIIKKFSIAGLDNLYENYTFLLPGALKHRLPGNKLHKFSDILTSRDPDDLYLRLSSFWKKPEELVFGSKEPHSILQNGEVKSIIPDFTARIMFFDLMTYLPDDILVKVDRASMSVGLEARVPILDHRVVEFSRRLPNSYKIKNGRGKWIIRKILYKYVPQKLVDRPKMGFGIPLYDWLRGPLREWAEGLLDKRKLEEDGILNPLPILEIWRKHLSGKGNLHCLLWDVLMFQLWKEKWL